jgi:hypothetical protein
VNSGACTLKLTTAVIYGFATRRARADLTADLESQSLKAHNFAPRRARTYLTADLECLILWETRQLYSTR